MKVVAMPAYRLMMAPQLLKPQKLVNNNNIFYSNGMSGIVKSEITVMAVVWKVLIELSRMKIKLISRRLFIRSNNLEVDSLPRGDIYITTNRRIIHFNAIPFGIGFYWLNTLEKLLYIYIEILIMDSIVNIKKIHIFLKCLKHFYALIKFK